MRMFQEPRRVSELSVLPCIREGLVSGAVQILHLPPARFLATLERGDMIWLREGYSVEGPRPSAPDWLDVAYLDGSRRRVRWPRALAAPTAGYHSHASMPMHLSRITLVVLAAQRMRLQQVTEEDASLSGVALAGPDGFRHLAALGDQAWPSAREAYSVLWELMWGFHQGWEANPEVVELRVTTVARCICDLVPGLGHGGVR